MTSRITIIIPTYNEAQNITPLLALVRTAAPSAAILVVDDSSPDGTAEIARRHAVGESAVQVLIRAQRQGLGKAYEHAFRFVRDAGGTDYALMMDADFSHNPKYIPKLLEYASPGTVVMGSRYVGHGSGTRGWELWRRILSRFGNLYCRLVTGLPVHDCTAGFMLVPVHYLTDTLLSQLDSSGYAFLMELKYLLWKSGAQFREVPIVFANRREGESKISNHIIGEGLMAPWRMIFKRR